MKLDIYLFLTTVTSTCYGLYEDQINKYDWKKEYIGRVNQVTFDGSLSISKNVFVITEKRVLASISSKTGVVNWRYIHNDDLVAIRRFADGIVTVTSDGVVRVWDQSTALLKSDINLSQETKEKEFKFLDIAVIEQSYSEGNLIVVLSTNALYVVRTATAAKAKLRVKTLEIETTEQEDCRLLYSSASKDIIILKILEMSHTSVVFVDAKTVEVRLEQSIPTSWLDDSSKVAVTENNRIVYLSIHMDAIYVVDIDAGKEIANQPLSNFELSSKVASLTGTDVRDIDEAGNDFFLGLQNGEVVHLRLNEENSISTVSLKSALSSVAPQIRVKAVGSEQYYFVVAISGTSVQMTASDLRTGKEDESMRLKYTSPSNIEQVFINMFLKRTTPLGYRVMVTTMDDSVIMLGQPTRVAWVREESLSSVVAAEMLDLPLSDIEAGIEVEFEQAEKHSIFEMFQNRIVAQISQVQSFAKQITRGIKEGTLLEKKTKDPLIQVEGLTRDPFSLHKMLVLVTERGKLFGVDSLTGEIVWRLHCAEMSGWKLQLFIQRTTAHFPHPPVALLLGISKNDDQPSLMKTFNPITGELLSKTPIEIEERVLQVVFLPFLDSAYLRPMLLLDNNFHAHLIPDSDSVRQKLMNVKTSTFLYRADKDSGLVQGFTFGNGMVMEVTWSLKIPGDQKIIAVEGKSPFEKVDSMGRPLANRSVIYKYLNPNLVALVTCSRDSDNGDTSSVTMWLIDGVTGHIVHTAVHKKASGPVHVIHTENWILYSYWKTKARRTEIASIELYEGKQLHNTTTFSSFNSLPQGPLIVQQAYIFSSMINAIGVSKTEKGLTSRQILFGLARGGVIGMPRRLFDPRRPIHALPSHREEGLIPYVPLIQFHPSLFLNYNKTVHGITGIYSCSSALESTSIVLATGLDIFFTRTQPSKMFDVLKDDFDYLLIVAVVSGMFLAAIVTRKWAQIKKLNRAWR